MSGTVSGAKVLKRELRKRVRSAVKSLSASDLKQQSEHVVRLLLSSPTYVNAKNIALFSSMPGELDTSPLLVRAFADEKRVFLPRVASKRDHHMLMLETHSMEEMDGWTPSDWDILEPPVEDGRQDSPRDAHLDLIVVPGVAFDATGARCGQGMGFYDTYFARYAKSRERMPTLVALALAPQVVDEVPMTETDWRVDIVISPFSSSDTQEGDGVGGNADT